jgi:dTDP-4-dehydrorhamnose 3,5-epimerase
MRRVHGGAGAPQVFEPKRFTDSRGVFFESWNAQVFTAHGVGHPWVQDNHSISHAGVVRGLHFQVRTPQAKLVRVVVGRSWHVVVDLRRGPEFGRWTAVELSAACGWQLYVPTGFAHGFCALEDVQVLYKVSAPWDPDDEGGVRWNDPVLNIPWPVTAPMISHKDHALPLLDDAGVLF